ncbi:tetratricopeptide repeat-containing sensor histidine kinase [Flavobacterium sp.]|uniref:tetratricopeptide repeat-containing sensor histidine kinase n=1 Tax=Flavobacterium sp. TaxID=239 RepID=UPI003C580C5F
MFHFPILIIIFLLLVFISCKKERTISSAFEAYPQYNQEFNAAEKYLEKQIFDSAFYYYNSIKNKSNPKTQPNRIIYTLLKLSYIQQVQGDYFSSEATATEAIPLFDNNTDQGYKASIYNILGINYKNLFNYNQSIFYYNQAFQLATDSLQASILKNNIAVVYKDQKKYDKAYQILSELVLKKEIIDSPENYARVLDNLGYISFKLNLPKSIFLLEQGLQIRKENSNHYGIIISAIHLAEYYKNSNTNLAISYAKLAYHEAISIHSIDDALDALKLLIETSNQTEVKKYALVHINLSDSLYKVRQKAKNQFAKIKYDASLEKEENLLLKTEKAENALELEQKKYQNLMLVFSVFCLILAILLLYSFWRRKNKREKRVATYETETRISKKLHDELANEVYRTITFVETQSLDNLEKKELLLENLDRIYDKTRNISRQNSGIKTGLLFGNIFNEMLMSYNSIQTNILIKGSDTVDWGKIAPEKQIEIYRIIQELLTNMKKHSKASIVIIGFEVLEKLIQIKYTDNGIGFNPKNIPKNGLTNVENRINSINGSISFDSQINKGLQTTIQFPK